ncbi:SAICAR synthase-like protein [Mytilinidion resinicola]|uniref:1-phosphatidylinositol-4-phosphate 5-kinase n=1 Tax=Mytilinidion resinicola TaxID=574789 RepID=A0A6A6YXH4_9PEZI|nr:SAICAR synthase-like protein [Mytilinidion resinicola]KAF2813656.1 SAICAR synthase-like protein [Mytilinidion resinicola]
MADGRDPSPFDAPAAHGLNSPTPQEQQPSSVRDDAARLSNGDSGIANGKLANGLAAMHLVANGHPVQPTSSWDKPLPRKEDSGTSSGGRMSDTENERAPLGRGRSNGEFARDDGRFAAIQNGDVEDSCGTTHVKLEALDSQDGASESTHDISRSSTKPGPEVMATPGNGSSTSHPVQLSHESNLRVPGSAHRLSSPPAFPLPPTGLPGAPTSNPSPQHSHRLTHRHTLEVPKVSSTRQSREFPTPSGTEDVVSATGRFSPNTPTRRRNSLSLARRHTRSVHSDMHLEEPPQDEDAARWADAIRQKRASKRKRKEDEDDDRVVVGTKVDQNHVNWVTAYNMLTGIRFTVSRTNAKMDRDLTDADFTAKHKFSFDITGNELTPSAKYDFKFKDYAPWVFRHLRSIFQLDPADYLMSLTSKYILSELGSPGKSGSFFYFSRDYKYIIKTIHHAEHKFLRKILRDYYDHVQENPNTLLSQFYGLHRVKIPYGRKIHFVVMNNLFPPHRDIHRTFDLKGSTIGRDFKEDELEHNPRATLKDLNWLRRNLHLEFGPTKKKAFIEQMEKDVKLLQKLKIMDYSLLVGIHDLERGNEENLRDKTLQVFQPGGESADDPVHANMLMRTPSKLETARKAKELRQMIKYQKPIPMDQTTSKMPDEMQEGRKNFYFYNDDGGFRATHEDDSVGEEIYYLGIIDCLTHYSFIKRAEHFFKGLVNTESQISAIPPERYGDRFVRFISGVTKTREAAEREKIEAEHMVDDPRLSGVNMHQRDATDVVMEKAERQAERSRQRGASEDNVPNREIRTVRSPSAERGELGSTLPVVEEAAESASTGGRSGRSVESSPLPHAPMDERDIQELQPLPRDRARGDSGHQKPPPTPPKDPNHGRIEERPPTPPKDGFEARRGPPTPPKDERERGRRSEKELPLPPPMESVVRVN